MRSKEERENIERSRTEVLRRQKPRVLYFEGSRRQGSLKGEGSWGRGAESERQGYGTRKLRGKTFRRLCHRQRRNIELEAPLATAGSPVLRGRGGVY